MFLDADFPLFVAFFERHHLPIAPIIVSLLKKLSRLVGQGYVVLSELHGKKKLKRLSESLRLLANRLQQSIDGAQEQGITNHDAIKDKALLAFFQEKLDSLIKKVDVGHKAGFDYSRFCGNEFLKKATKPNSNVRKTSSNITLNKDKPNYFQIFAGDIFNTIFKNLSFYDKQKLRQVCKRLRTYVDDNRVTEDAIIYPLKDKWIIFFINHVDAELENTTNAVTVKRIRNIVEKNFPQVKEHIIQVASQEMIESTVGKAGAQGIFIYVIALLVLILLGAAMYGISRINNPAIKYPLLTFDVVLMLADVMLTGSFSCSESFRKTISECYSNYKYRNYFLASNSPSLRVSESSVNVESLNPQSSLANKESTVVTLSPV